MKRTVYLSNDAFCKENEALGTNLPFAEDTSVLSAPLTVGKYTIPNRLVCQPMEGCDSLPDGTPSELTLRRYNRIAKGGVGLIWYEATAVLPEGRANPRQLYIDANNTDAFKRQLEAIKTTTMKEHGFEPIVVMQITHSGRYSKPNGKPEPLIAYSNPVFEGENPIDKSRIVSDEYLDSVRDALVNAAVLAKDCGFDGVDIKCCHRYLNCELLSAYTRAGRYGGSLENRTRLLRESLAGVFDRCGKDFLASTRINMYDGYAYPYGFGVRTDGSLEFDPTEPIRIAKTLAEMGVQIMNITMGNPYSNPHVNRPYAQGGYEAPEHPLEGVARILNGIKQIKAQVPEMKFISSALTYLGVAAPHVAAAMIDAGAYDLAGFGRTVFAYPEFANDILKTGEMNPKQCCIACSKCTVLMRAGHTPGCIVRDPVYTEIFKKEMV